MLVSYPRDINPYLQFALYIYLEFSLPFWKIVYDDFSKNTEYFSRHSNFQMDEGCFCDEYLLSSMFGSSGSNGRGT